MARVQEDSVQSHRDARNETALMINAAFVSRSLSCPRLESSSWTPLVSGPRDTSGGLIDGEICPVPDRIGNIRPFPFINVQSGEVGPNKCNGPLQLVSFSCSLWQAGGLNIDYVGSAYYVIMLLYTQEKEEASRFN